MTFNGQGLIEVVSRWAKEVFYPPSFVFYLLIPTQMAQPDTGYELPE
jgi:hypothetical protein